MESVRAAYSACSLPPCGGGLGRGVARFGNAGASISRPPPPTPPHKGEGSTASVRYIFGLNTTKRAHGSFSLWKSARVPICKPTRTSMPQGSVIGTHHEIELVTPDVRAPSLFRGGESRPVRV